MLRRSRAVSEVMASLILLLIVSILGTSLYSYTITSTRIQQDALKGDVRMEAEKAQELFKVIAVWWSGYDDILNMTVLNYGKLDIKIVDIYVNDEKVINYQAGHDEEIYTSNLGKVIFTSPVALSEGTMYEIVIVSERGVSHVYGWKP